MSYYLKEFFGSFLGNVKKNIKIKNQKLGC
jgi:hypothetical protein